MIPTLNDQDWLTSTEVWKLLNTVATFRPSNRRVRLWNAAVCRSSWEYLPEESRTILEESENIADSGRERDGDALNRRANAVVGLLDRQFPTRAYPDRETRIRRAAAAAVCYAVLPGELQAAAAYFTEPSDEIHQVLLIRDIFGNPFRPFAFSAAWKSDTAVSLAKHIYESRDFSAMPILADALQDAGCDNDDVLNHCRDPQQVHVRGCWVVDLALGKS